MGNKQAVINTGVGVAASFCGSYINNEGYIAKDRTTGRPVAIDPGVDVT
jgi:hypothetical protein